MRFFQLTLGDKHITDECGRSCAFTSSESAIDFAIEHKIRYDRIYEVCIMPADYIVELERKANHKPS